MGYVYILTSYNHRVLYIGVTGNLQRRLYEHTHETVDGFTKRYHVHYLVYFECYNQMIDAIHREKQLKGWTRKRKVELINAMNPSWEDLSQQWEE